MSIPINCLRRHPSLSGSVLSAITASLLIKWKASFSFPLSFSSSRSWEWRNRGDGQFFKWNEAKENLLLLFDKRVMDVQPVVFLFTFPTVTWTRLRGPRRVRGLFLYPLAGMINDPDVDKERNFARKRQRLADRRRTRWSVRHVMWWCLRRIKMAPADSTSGAILKRRRWVICSVFPLFFYLNRPPTEYPRKFPRGLSFSLSYPILTIYHRKEIESVSSIQTSSSERFKLGALFFNSINVQIWRVKYPAEESLFKVTRRRLTDDRPKVNFVRRWMSRTIRSTQWPTCWTRKACRWWWTASARLARFIIYFFSKVGPCSRTIQQAGPRSIIQIAVLTPQVRALLRLLFRAKRLVPSNQ